MKLAVKSEIYVYDSFFNIFATGSGIPPHQHLNAIDKDKFANPLPHVLMLTAIVVGVSTLGLALAISQKVHGSFGTLEEDEILDQLKPGGHD